MTKYTTVRSYNVRCSKKKCGIIATGLTFEQALHVSKQHSALHQDHTPVWYAVNTIQKDGTNVNE